MILYTVPTNTGTRPEWSEFLIKQHAKWPETHLVVIDNAEKPSTFFTDRGIEYHHIPQCKYNSYMFNWFVQNHGNRDAHLFYMDDDIELSSDICDIDKFFDLGWDGVFILQAYVTSLEHNKSYLWKRQQKNIGAGFLLHADVWIKTEWDESMKSGGIHIMNKQLRYADVNIHFLRRPLLNYMVHGKNLVMKHNSFPWDRERVYLK